MRIDEIEARKAEIRAIISAENAEYDVDALTEEVRALNEEAAEIENRAAKEAEIRNAVAPEVIAEIENQKKDEDMKMEDRTFAVDSKEYRSAWLKNMQGVTLSADEQRAFTAANGAISVITANAIMDVVRDHAPILEKMTVVYSPSNINYYIEGTNNDAADHTENASITAAADTLTKISLVPAEIVKMIQVSESAKVMSVDAFESWLAKNLGEAIARKINSKIVAAIAEAASSAGTAITAATVQALLGAVKGSSVNIVCNRKTLFTGLLPLQDNSKSSIVRFEGAAASVYGVPVLVDDNVADKTVLAGDMSKAIAAMAEDVSVRQSYDINTNSYKYLGVALFDCKIGIANAFAKIVSST